MRLFEDDFGVKKKRKHHKKHRIHKINYIGKIKPRKRRHIRKISTKKRNKGWFFESNRHKLARKGIKTGTKRMETFNNFMKKRKERALIEREQKETKKEQEQKEEYVYDERLKEEKEKEETVKYIYEWEDNKGDKHYTLNKPNFFQHKGSINMMKYEDYIKKLEIKN